MFHFMKKDKDDKKKDKDKDKDKKKDKKERRITLEELRRLEEARRSLVGKTKKKEKLPSGITADFMQSFTQAEREALASRGSVTSMADAAGGSVPPRPPKRTGGSVVSLRGSLQDYQLVADSLVTGPAAAGAESSVRNEVLNYERLLQRRTSGASTSSGAAAPAAAAAAAPPLPIRPPPSPSQSTQSTPSSSSVQRLARQFEAVPRGSPTTLSPSGSMRSSASSATTLSEPRAGEASGGRAPHRFPGHELRLPALHAAPPPPPRLLRIARLPGGDFGFALRRAVVQERTAAGESRRPVILAEPGRSSSEEPGGTGLLPGDRLIEVNGVSVEDADREKVVALIRASGDTVTLKVQPIPEVSELSQRRAVDGSQLAVPEDGLHPARRDGTLRRTGSLRFANKAKTEDQLASERAWLDAEQVWLVHKDGFSAARLLRAPAGAAPPGADGTASDTSALSSGRVRIRLQDTGETIEVDEDDIEKANPPQFDQCEELSQLRHLNESSVLHTLRQRYGGNLIHTAAGASTVIVNPMSSLSIYTDKVIQMFRGCKPDDMPPHIYSTAQSTYRALLGQRRDQGVVLLGRSGSGKTTNAKHLLHYLVAASQAAAPPSAAPRAVTVEKLAAVWTLLEAFGNCRTVLNTNATRFTSVFSLDFDQSGQAASGSVQVLMLERDRVVRRPEGEPSFHVFYQLLAGADPALRQRLQLDDAGAAGGDGVGFVTPLQRVEDRQRAAAAWARLQRAVDVLSIHPAEADALWSVLAAIVHLGVAGVSKGPSDKYQFADPAAARRAASLLGVPLEDLARAMFAAQSSGAATLQRTAYRTPPRAADLAAAPDPLGREALEAFVAGLYGDLVSVLVSLVNRAISSPAHTINSVVVVDAPGLQNPSSCGRPGGATFDEFCFNYVQERLQLLFHEQTFVHERDRYAQENIALNMSELEGDVSTPAPLVQTLDRAPATRLVRGPSQQDLRGAERRGLLWLLDEEALQQAPSDAGFLRTALDMYSQRGDQQVVSKGPSDDHMVLQHFQGTNPVTYNVSGWVRAARETAASRAAAQLLYESTREALSRLFVTARGAGLGPAVAGGSVVGIDGSLSLRRASSIRRTFTSGAAGIKRNSRALLVKFQLDGVVEQLRRTRVRFVHCLLPQHTAGLCELAATSGAAPATPQKTASPEEIIINVPLLRSQLRGAQLLDALRLHKQGYPEHMPFSEFRRRFALLAPDVTADAGDEGDERAVVDQLMLQLDVDAASYRLGLSQIFFRSGALSQLEERRDERLQDKIVRLQARCRGLLARKKFARRKVQDVAIRCIQKNVRKYMGVREWPWWRLLVRVTPLLDVHRTEQQLQSATEELAALREKVERLEKENTTYKHENDRLESKLGEVTADLAEEHHTATLATERLEAEQAERMRLESDLQSVQSEYQKTSALNERLEKELLYRRTSAELGVSSDGDGDEEDGELGSAAAYQRKYEYTARELAYTRQRLEQQHEDDVEQMMVLKKQLDKKVEAAYEEVDEQRQIVAQQKRKVARLTGEANDLRIHLEEQTSRNTVLEKKQRKFDIDMHALQEELRHEKQQREAAVRQADQLQREKCSLDNDASALRLELEMQEEKVTALRRELDELSSSGAGGTEDEVSALRRARLDLQHKCQEQEEELDDMAGQVSLLEQAKLRLEMSLEQMRKEHRREVSQKDDELEEIRANASKKLKGLEAQLETEHEERTALVREKHELERRIIMLNETTISQDDQEAILKLKRDLKRTRALLKDAQAQLEKARSEASSKVQIRQLKNQLEDAEFARGAAVKARQSLAQELQETQALLAEAQRARTDTETRYLTASRELHQLQAQLDDQEEETQEVMKKYKAAVAQLSVDQLTLQDQASQLTQLEAERAALREQLAEQATRLDALQGETASAHDQRRLELRVRELESRCEFEQTTKLRLETQAARLKEAVEKASNESEQARQREQHAADQLRKLQRQLRESKDELSEAERKESDAVMQARSLAKELESAEGEVAQARADLKLAFKRIGDLQNAMQCELESDASDSEAGSDSDEEDLDSFMSAHMAAGGSGARRTSAAAGGQPLSILTDGRSAGSESTPLSPLSLASDPELRPRQNGALESDA